MKTPKQIFLRKTGCKDIQEVIEKIKKLIEEGSRSQADQLINQLHFSGVKLTFEQFTEICKLMLSKKDEVATTATDEEHK